jgi:hypothetical protein
MATGTREYKDLPLIVQVTVKKLERLGYPEGRWLYVENHRPGDAARNVQVRGQKWQARPEDVNAYASALLNGEQLPPVIFTQDGWLVDGITRTAAVAKIKWQAFHAIVLDERFEDAPAAVVDQLMAVAAKMNLDHGRNLTKADKVRWINQFTRPGDSPSDVHARLGGAMSVSMVRNVMAAKSARERAEELGVDLSRSSVTQSHLMELASTRGKKYNDTVFRDFLLLIRDGALPIEQTRALSKKMNQMGDDQERLDLLAAERRNIAFTEPGTPRARPRPSAKLRQRYGFILNYEDEPGLLLEAQPDEMQGHVEQTEAVIEVLQNVAKAQRNLINQHTSR